MKTIQPVLILIMLALFALYLVYFRSLLRDRLIALLLLGASIVAVLAPDLTSRVALAIGVGRGTDLVFYLFAVASMFVFVLLYMRVSRLAQAQTEIVRALAMLNAKKPQQHTHNPT